jgi:DNA-binding MarR family transcriptional regulator
MADKLNLVELIDVITRFIGDAEVELVKKIEDAGLTLKLLSYMETVARLKNPALGELAEELALSKPSVTAIVEKLSALGYVERVQSDEDRRSAHVHVSKKGMKILAMHDDAHRAIAGFFEETLDKPDLERLVEILNRAVKKLG